MIDRIISAGLIVCGAVGFGVVVGVILAWIDRG